MVDSEEIVGSLDELLLSISEGGESVSSDEFLHVWWVVSEDNGVVVPSVVELQAYFNGFQVIRIR